MTSTTWTKERVSLLIRLWRDGASARQIAAALGDGVTRSAVIGKIHRLGLGGDPLHSSPGNRALVRAADHRRQLRRVQQTPQPSTEAPPTPAGPGLATVLTVGRHDCRWPLGDPLMEGFTLCGRPVARGSYLRAARRTRLPAGRPAKDSLVRLADLG